MVSSRRRKVPIISTLSNGLLPDEERDVRKEIAGLIAEPDEWLRLPNSRLGGSKPEDLIGTEREQLLRDLLRAIKYGIPT
jgi:hypothetical protein